ELHAAEKQHKRGERGEAGRRRLDLDEAFRDAVETKTEADENSRVGQHLHRQLREARVAHQAAERLLRLACGRARGGRKVRQPSGTRSTPAGRERNGCARAVGETRRGRRARARQRCQSSARSGNQTQTAGRESRETNRSPRGVGRKDRTLEEQNLQFSHSAEKSCHLLIPPERSIFSILSS